MRQQVNGKQIVIYPKNGTAFPSKKGQSIDSSYNNMDKS